MAGALTLLLPSVAPAVTAAEFKCQLAASKGVATYAAAAVRCLVECHAGGGCAGGALDAPAAACTDAARAVAEKKISRKCDPAVRPSNQCPSCYGSTDCAAQALAPLTILRDTMDVALRAALCDDASSVDGLTAGEAACEQAAASRQAALATATSKCLQRCERKARRDPAVACDAVGIWDAKTEACVAAASAQYGASCAGCGEQPECRSFPPYHACPHMGVLVSGTILPLSSAIFCDTP